MPKRISRRRCLEGIKPYAPGKPVEELERELGITNAVKLASNENALGPSPLAVEALRKALSEVNYYPDANCYYLRQALAEKLNLDPEQFIFANGSDESLKLIAETYINPGEEGVIADPTFSEYEFVLRIMDGIPRKVPMRPDFSHDLEAMLAAVNERTRLVFLCSPNNPTGTIIKRRELERFLDRLPAGVLVVIDEAYYEYVSEPDYFDSLNYLQQYPVITLRTFSKIYGLAGLRLGYAVAAKEIIADINRVCEPFNVNHLAQKAALAALKDEAYLQKSRQMIAEGREQLAAGFSAQGLSFVPTQANFFFVDLGHDSQEVFQELLQRGVIIRTGDIFGYPSYARITIGTKAENERLLCELEAVLKELQS
jgi:histidinol-phosphate aminotransferase